MPSANICNFHDSNGCRDQVKSATGVDLMNIDRERGHVTASTTKNPKDVKRTPQCKTMERDGHVTVPTAKNPKDVKRATQGKTKKREGRPSLKNSQNSSVPNNEDTVVDTTVADVGARENIHDGISIDMKPEDVKLALEHKTEKSVVLLPSLNNSQSSSGLNNQDTVIVSDLRTTVAVVGGRENVHEEINADDRHENGPFVFLLLPLVCILVFYWPWHAIAAILLVCYYYLLPAGPWNPKKLRTPTSPVQLTVQPFSLENNSREIEPQQRTLTITDGQVVKERPENNSCEIEPQQRTITITDGQVVNERPGSGQGTDSHMDEKARCGSTSTISKAISGTPTSNLTIEYNGCKINIETERSINPGQVIIARPGSSGQTYSYTNESTLTILTSSAAPTSNHVRTPTSNLTIEYNGCKINIETESSINPGQVIIARPGEDEFGGHCKSNHQHDLVLKSARSSYKCSGCKESGSGKRYECELCSYFLHPDCMYYKETATHDFLDKSVFNFYQKPFGVKRCCDACRMDIKGFFYHCKETSMDLHPCCLNLRKTVPIGVPIGNNHNFHLSRVLRSKCWWCKSKKNKDQCWCYSSENQDCHFHVYCLKDAMDKILDGGGGAKDLVKRKNKFKNKFKWVVKFLDIVLNMLMGNPIPIPLFGVGVELLFK